MRKFHEVSWAERAQLAEAFEDDRLKELTRRLVYLEEPSALALTVRVKLEGWLYNRRNGREGVLAGRTLDAALEEAEKLVAEIPTKQAGALEEIRCWLATMRSKILSKAET